MAAAKIPLSKRRKQEPTAMITFEIAVKASLLLSAADPK